MYIAGSPCGPVPVQGPLGLGCVECGCSSGLGEAFLGQEVFTSGLDFSQWGWREWGLTGLGAYILFSFFWAQTGFVQSAHDYRFQRRRKKAAYYRKKASELSRA